MKRERKGLSRRTFVAQSLRGSLLAVAGLAASSGASANPVTQNDNPGGGRKNARKMKLGMVTYNLAKDWDLDTIIERCEATGFQGVELRTTHAHKVESNLTQEERENVRAKFEASKVALVSLGTAFEYHSPDPATVRRNVEGTKEYLQLARDVGCRGMKVRPNRLPPEVPFEKTIRQIGESLRECGRVADKLGVEMWVEVHGQGTSQLPVIRKILDVASHPFVKVCWNCNATDIVDGSVKQSFDLVKEKIGSVHIHDLYDRPAPPGVPRSTLAGGDYPYMELFGLLKESGFDGYCFAEIPGSTDPLRVMQYYRALWEMMVSAA